MKEPFNILHTLLDNSPSPAKMKIKKTKKVKERKKESFTAEGSNLQRKALV